MQTMISTPKCVAALVKSIDANSRVIVSWTFAIPNGKFPEGDKFKKWILNLDLLISSEYGDAESELVSVWLGVHASDMLQREFNYKRQSAQKAILRCFRFTNRLSKVSEESRHSSRAIKMMDRYWTELALSIFDMHKFLSRLVDVIGQEIKQTVVPEDKPEQVDGLVDGLDRSKGEFVWCGGRYEWLTETMMDALQVLHKAYRDDRKVWPDEMENIIGSLPDGGFFKVFKVDRAGWPSIHPVRAIVGGRANSGWYLIEKNSSQS